MANIAVLMGESGSGKSYLQNELVKFDPVFKKIVTCTTRPRRKNEVDGIDYNFISEAEFENKISENAFVEYKKYRDWYYGLPKSTVMDTRTDDEHIYIAVLTPSGFRTLQKWLDNTLDKVLPLYVKTDERQRLKMLIDRGDNITEIFRRYLTELGQFDGVENEAYLVKNKYDTKALLDIGSIIYNKFEDLV